MEHQHKELKKLFIGLSFIVLTLLITQIVHSTTQSTFVLNLDNLVFKYQETALNDSSTSKNILYSTSGNETHYIRVPKNSTVYNSSLSLTGVVTPYQTTDMDKALYSVAVGNVTPDSENQVVIGMNTNMTLLNSSLTYICDFTWSSHSGIANAVSIGNITADVGNEIAIVTDFSYLYIINSSCSHEWNKTDSFNDVAIGEFNSTYSGNEVVAVSSGDTKVYVFNSSGHGIWNYTTDDDAYSVAIGDVNTTYAGNEIVIGDATGKVYLLNSSGKSIRNLTIGNDIESLDVGDVVSDTGNEIVVGLRNNTVYLINSTLDIKWSYDTTGRVYGVAIGDITSDYSGNEVVAGSADKKVYSLNSTGSSIWNYTAGDQVYEVAIGDINQNETTYPKNETVVISIDQNIYIFSFDYFPTNTSLDIGNNSTYEWTQTGKFRTTENVPNATLVEAIQDYLDNTCDTQNCSVPLVFHSDTSGNLSINNISVTYDYNASEAISYATLTQTWSRTNDTTVNESIGYEVKSISYETPSNTIQVQYVKINDTATQCDFAGIHYSSNTTVDGQNVCDVSDYTVTSGESHLLWDDNMTTSIPVYMNETSYSVIGELQKKNMTIWNVTPTIFYNVTANTTINETLIKYNQTLKVIWNGQWCDITPSSEDSNCNESSPSYTAVQCGSDYFYVCMKDLGGSSGVDFFTWKQPHTSETIYELSGSGNIGGNLTNANVTPASDIWGNNFTFTVNVTDTEGDNVTVNLWIYLNNSGVWEEMDTKNTTSNITETPETLEFNVTSNNTWTGSNKYKFRYRDFNETDDTYFHEWEETDEQTNWNVTKHNITIKYIAGNNSNVNRTSGNVSFIIQVNDTDNSSYPVEGDINCSFWITTDTSSFDSGSSTVTNSSGHCNYTFDPDSTYSPGQQEWIGGTFDNVYYHDQNSTNNYGNFTVNVYGQLNINLTGSILSQNFTRRQNITIEAMLYDEFDSLVQENDYNCTFYILNASNVTVNTTNTITNSTGYCNFTWRTNCSNNVGMKTINVTLSGNASTYYFIEKNNHTTNTTLKDNLIVTINTTLNGSIVHEGTTIILNATVNDSCSCPEEYYNVSWYFEKSDLCPPSNPVAIGKPDNASWTINVPACSPRQQTIIANASGDFYDLGEDNVTIFIYGWSSVDIITPTSGAEINRSDVGESYDIVCKVIDVDRNSGIGNYPVNFYQINETEDEKSIGTNITNTTSGSLLGGYAVYEWNISNSTVTDGNYTIICNISDNTTQSLDLYYNASVNNDTEYNITVLGNPDIIAPNIVSVSISSVKVNQNTTVNASITDFYGVDKVWINIIYPNKTNISTFNLALSSGSIKDGTWNLSTNLTDRGEYNFTLYVNDTSNHTNSTTGWFEVYLPITFYGNTTDSSENNVSVDFTFYRNGTNTVIHNFSTTSSNAEYNETVRNRSFDIEVKAYNHSVRFFLVDINETTVNSVKNMSTFTTSLYDIIGVRNYLKTLMFETTFNYSSVNLTLNYSDVISTYTAPTYPHPFRETDLDIYKCANFSLPGATFNCLSGWTNLNVDPNLTADTITVNMTTLSGFILGDTADSTDGACERGETCAYDSTCCGGTSGDGGGPGGAGVGGTGSVCGNGECETGENVYNCPEDCGSPEIMFSLRTNLTSVELDTGEKRTYALWILNNVKYALNTSISIVGTVSEFIDLEKNILTVESQAEEIVKMYVAIPEGIDPGTYTGEIVVIGDGKTKSIPITIRVSIKGAVSLDVYVESLNKMVGLNETARFRIILNKYGIGKLDSEFTYLIKEFETGEKIYEEKESRKVETQFQTIVKSIPLDTVNITAGHYFFEVVVDYDNRLVTATDDFYVITTFWSTDRVTQVVFISVLIISVIAVYFARKWYKKWKLSKARYIFPLDMRKLPKGKIWLGKIAETGTKAYFNMDELKTHVLTAGATGSGKSVSACIFVEELLEEKIPVVVFDPTAQWTGFVRPCRDSNLIKYYKEFGLSRDDAKPYTGMIYEVTDPKVKIDFKKYMNPGEITVFTLNKLKPGQYDVAVRNIIDTIFAQGWEESTKLKMVIVFDEVHRLLEKYGGKGGYVSLEKACREFRKWGIGLIMASQVLSDFKEAIKGNVLTEIQLHTKSLGDLGRVEKKYGLDYAKKVTRLEVGVGMMQNPRYNEGRPWFVSFRPTLHSPHKIPDEDMKTYKEYAAILEGIESKIEKMEKSGIDVFDLKTEFRLASEKLKKGRFRMAKIYIDSLKKHLSRE